ncbi:MAG: hypothetical protein HZB56_17825 [Deltaproteobacteria bacterium]|nr:hypothetical protein [Deltaproteobacteria bacterium]
MTRSLSAAVALAALAAACSPEHWSPPPVPPPPPIERIATQPAGYTSPMAVAQVGGQAKLYVPTGTYHFAGPIAVLDLSVPGRGTRGAGARVATIDVGGGEYATLVGGDARVLVAASARFPTAWIIDPATDRVTRTIPLGDLGFSTYGARDAHVTGVIVDSGRNRAWLAVWNGFLAIDLTRGERVPAEDVAGAPSESPAYDPVRGLIYAPFYGCAGAHGPAGATPPPCAEFTTAGGAVMDAGMYVVRVSDRARFTLRRPGASEAAPLGLEPDAISIDVAAGLALVAEEAGGSELVLDLASATFDATAGTVELTAATAYAEIPGVAYACTATLPATGDILLAAEFAPEVALATSARLLAGQGPIIAEMPLLPLPGAVAWSTAGDPHGAAIVQVGGKRYGLLLRDLHDWVARIDLDAVDALSPVSPSSLTAAEMAQVVDFLDTSAAP